MTNNIPSPDTLDSDQIGSAARPPGAMPFDVIRVMLNIMAPDEPLGGLKTYRKRWSRRVHALRKEFPGYQPHIPYRDSWGSFRHLLRASCDEALPVVINYKKGRWSRDIEHEYTRLPFEEWLQYNLDDDPYDNSGAACEAMEFLRKRYGLTSPSPWATKAPRV